MRVVILTLILPLVVFLGVIRYNKWKLDKLKEPAAQMGTVEIDPETLAKGLEGLITTDESRAIKFDVCPEFTFLKINENPQYEPLRFSCSEKRKKECEANREVACEYDLVILENSKGREKRMSLPEWIEKAAKAWGFYDDEEYK